MFKKYCAFIVIPCQVWWVGLLLGDFENNSLFGEREQTNSYP
jgi:hypothetical protein